MEERKAGINIADYTAEKAAGTIQITKPVAASENYVVMRITFTVGRDATGNPIVVEGAPELANINRGTIADLREGIAAEQAKLNNLLAQIAAIETDMSALDVA